MKLERHSGPIQDPFMAAVRRRHPDVDIVLLPSAPRVSGETGSAESTPAPDPETARGLVDDLLRRVAATVDRLWARAGDDPAVVLRARSESLVAGPAMGTVEARSRLVADTGDGAAVLSRLAAVLHEEGWRVDRTDGGVHRLAASGDGLVLRATQAAGAGALMCEVLSEAVEVGPGVARLVLEGGR
ncbi:hypothetical protein [Nocardioides pacificus]